MIDNGLAEGHIYDEFLDPRHTENTRRCRPSGSGKHPAIASDFRLAEVEEAAIVPITVQTTSCSLSGVSQPCSEKLVLLTVR